MKRILIVEDEAAMATGLEDNLKYENFEVLIARDGEEGLRRAVEEHPDLILLDLMLPRMGGLDVCHHIRCRGLTMPIIMLTARGQEVDKVVGLEAGADDYVTKPFGIRELVARIRARLRERSGRLDEIAEFHFGDVDLDFRRFRATKAGRPIGFTPRQFELLKYLIQREGEVVTRDEILDRVWGLKCFPLTRTVDNQVARIRRQVEANPRDPQHLVTIHRIGYRFVR